MSELEFNGEVAEPFRFNFEIAQIKVHSKSMTVHWTICMYPLDTRTLLPLFLSSPPCPTSLSCPYPFLSLPLSPIPPLPHLRFPCLSLFVHVVGGIYTVIRSKAGVTTSELGDQYCMIGKTRTGTPRLHIVRTSKSKILRILKRGI